MDMEEMDEMEGQESVSPEKGGAIAIVIKKKLGEKMEEAPEGMSCPQCGCKLKIEAAD